MIEWNDENVRDLNHENSCVIVDDPENSADNSCAVHTKIPEPQPCAVDVCDLGTRIVVQDQIIEAVDDQSVPDVGQNATDAKPSGYEMTVDESNTVLVSDEEKANETRLSSSIYRPARHVSGKKWFFFIFSNPFNKINKIPFS